MKPGMVVPAEGRSSGVSSKARKEYGIKLTAEGSESPKAIQVLSKMQDRALRQGAPQPGNASNIFGGVTRTVQMTKGGSNRRPPGYKPSKTHNPDSKVYQGLVGTSGAKIRRTTDVWGDDSEDESEEESGSNDNTNLAGDGQDGVIPAGTYPLEQALAAALAKRAAALAAEAPVLAGEGLAIDGVVVEVGVGAGVVPKPSEGGSSSSGGWGSSGTGSPRSSMGGLLEFGALLEVVGQRANHMCTHTVPKKARRLTAAMLEFGSDLSESADALAGRLRANSSKIATKVEAGWDKVVVKADKAGSKTKAFFGKLKSLVVCGSSNLPKM